MTDTATKVCFIIGPIGKPRSATRLHADTLLRKIIRPVFKQHFRDFIVERSDDIARPGMIDSQVVTQMLEADLVIADLTGNNANAFYEMGIRHLHHRPIVHMVKDGEQLPFDVAPFRTIVFSYDKVLEITDAKKALRKFVIEVLKPSFKVENPVTRSAGYIALQQGRTEPPPARINYKPGARAPFYFTDSPGIVVRQRIDGTWTAWWQARSDIVKAGFKPPIVSLWTGRLPEGITGADILRIQETTNALQKEMLAWAMHHKQSS